MRRVPLARRHLLADRRRLAASVFAVGLAVMLILLLQGMWSGVRRQARSYEARSGADLYVLQPGVRDLTPGVGTVDLSVLQAVRADRAVTWAAPVRSAFVVLQLHTRKVPVTLVGSEPGQPGGPWSVTAGRPVGADDEVVVGNVLARRHAIGLGDTLDVMGRSFRVVGRADTAGFMFSYVFVTHAAADRLSGASGRTTMVLVGTTDPTGVASRLTGDGINVLDRATVAANDVRFATGIFGSPIRLMVAIGFAGGSLIVALTSYTAILERRREYGIVKALGATRGRLVRVAIAQTLVFAGLGLLTGLGLFVAARALIAATNPQFTIVLDGIGVTAATVAATGMAAIAAVMPARRLARLQPAVAFRSAP